ncbi:CAP family protein [Novosphingobium huizhouense]|uniref:CAP family protein n=1 Tax=Novosphingobium huizhouense TaxID=2866625 RepID=UPI001CD838F9|nr:CAP family protein [Novosphingobium huizhouense]
MLDAHNGERLRLGLRPLAWSETLASAAREWAEQLARIDDLEHSDNSDRSNMGENLWMGTKGDFTPEEMVDGFIDERKDFTPGTFPDVSRTGDWADVGHYTQLIWPDTKQVGCGIAQNRQSEVLVCRYYPAGNVDGEQVP